jgi:hypothetical protein
MKTLCALLAFALALAGCGQPAATNEAAPPAASRPRQTFTLVNNSSHNVLSLNVSPNNSDEWGPNILGTDRLANGQTATIAVPPGHDQCRWDVRATYDEGEATDARGVDLCRIGTVTLSGE